MRTPVVRHADLALLALVVVVGNALGLHRFRDQLWGCHFYAFLPWFYFPIGTLTLVGVAARVCIGRAPEPESLSPRPVPTSGWAHPSAAPVILSLLATALFWTFRARHLLLGDGLPLTASVLTGDPFNPLEPLSMVVQGHVYRMARSIFAWSTTPSYSVAWSALALGSALAGGIFAAVVWVLCRNLPSDLGAPGRWTVLLCWAFVMSQGYVQLFFGYVENYALYSVGLACYVLFAVRYLLGRGPLWAPAVAGALCLFLHLSAAVVLPSFTFLVIAGLRDPARRGLVPRDLVISTGVFGALIAGSVVVAPGYNLPATLLAVTQGLLSPAAGNRISAPHLRDFLNELFLIGPAGAWCLAASAVRRPRAERSGIEWFMLTLGSTYVVACWMAPDSNLGFARNWDLLAPAGFVFATAALATLLDRAPTHVATQRLILALAISLYQTVPWIAVNCSEERSLQRFAVLPLGGGRAESTIGYWHALRGRMNEAESWLRRATVASPDNVRVRLFLGKLYQDQGRYRESLREYERAAKLRPDLAEAHLGAASAAARAGQPEAALSHMDEILSRHPDNARFWALRGVILLGLRQTEPAREALRRAMAIAPSDSAYPRALTRTYGPDAFDSLLRLHWEDMAVLR